MKSIYVLLPLCVALFSACGDPDIPTVTKRVDKPSAEVTSNLYALAKECWQHPNKIADVDVRLKEGESYETVVTKEIKTFTASTGDYNDTVIGAHYVSFDTNHKPKLPKYAPIITIRMYTLQETKTTVIINSQVKSIRDDVLYWIEYDRCK